MIDKETRERFIKLTEKMDVPDLRREPTETNLRWFIRNAWIRNIGHQNFEAAMRIAKDNS